MPHRSAGLFAPRRWGLLDYIAKWAFPERFRDYHPPPYQDETWTKEIKEREQAKIAHDARQNLRGKRKRT